MKTKFTIDRPMPPIWMMHPSISQYSIGWRMGGGEGYRYDLNDWLETLTTQEKLVYKEMFPKPIFWRDFEDKENTDELDSYSYDLISFWQKNGNPNYSISTLINSNDLEYLFFCKPNLSTIDYSCFGQGYPSKFEVDIDDYCCTEQYMMAEKARLFEDDDIEKQIMLTSDLHEIKALGEKIANFNQETWDKVKYSIVLNGNYYKFTQNKEMRDLLLATGDKVLVEASTVDLVWGIGLEENDPKAQIPTMWKGNNLLGFALMELRDELKVLYKNYERVDWQNL